MMKSALVAAVAFLGPALAVDWHFLTYYPPSGEQFVGFSGSMSVPDKPNGTYYLWPGLQPTDNSGVYQDVLDSRGSSWFWGAGWCCSNPSLPWGNGFNLNNGDTVYFSNTQGSSEWTSYLSHADGSNTATSSFPLNDKTFNQAIFAIEIYDGTWNFGPLTFTDVVITSTGTDTSFCNGYPSDYSDGTSFAATEINAVVNGNTVECHIGSLVMNGPENGTS